MEIRLTRPDGHYLEIETTNIREGASDTPTTTSRMVDLSIGLDLDEDDEEIVDIAFNKMPDNDQSLNQSLSYIKDTPLLVDLELKKSWGDRDPRVQLAVWKAGAFEKMQYHGWDTSMPMPGITVNGSEWDCFLSYVRDSDLVRFHPPAPLALSSFRISLRPTPLLKRIHVESEFGLPDHDGSLEHGIHQNRQWHLRDRLQTIHPDEVGEDRLRNLVQKAHPDVVPTQGCWNDACGRRLDFSACLTFLPFLPLSSRYRRLER